MRKIAKIAISTLALALPALAWASPEDDARGALEPRYAALRVAMETHDGSAIKALLAKNFQSTDIRGTTASADEMIEDLNRWQERGRGRGGMPGAGGPPAAGPAQRPERKTTLVSVTLKNDTALVKQKFDISGKRVGPDGAPHNFEMITLSDDTWKQVDGTWLLQSTLTSEMTILRDGVEVRHFKAGQ